MNQTTSPTPTGLYTTEETEYSNVLDMGYGVIYCLCFFFGLIGNILSLCYFMARNKDLPNTLYKIISLTDMATSIASLAVGISFLSAREPGLIFGNEVMCNVWTYVWHITSRLSIFLVVVLCGSRTYYLMQPFNKQRVAPSLLVILGYCLLQIGQTVAFQFQQRAEVNFVVPMARCVLLFPSITDKNIMLLSDVVRIFTFVLPMFFVFFSVLLSIRITLKRVDSGCMQKGSGRKELQKSRNRATVTILLFTGVYTFLNGPLVVSEILQTIDYHCDYKFDFHSFDYNGQYMLYYDNFVSLMSVSLNAAINPLLYLWRMPGCKTFIHRKSLQIATPRKSCSKRDSTVTEFFAMSRINQRLSIDKCSQQNLSVSVNYNGSIQSL